MPLPFEAREALLWKAMQLATEAGDAEAVATSLAELRALREERDAARQALKVVPIRRPGR